MRQKERIRDAIKELIEKKIKLIESKKVIKKRVIIKAPVPSPARNSFFSGSFKKKEIRVI